MTDARNEMTTGFKKKKKKKSKPASPHDLPISINKGIYKGLLTFCNASLGIDILVTNDRSMNL